MTLPNPDQPLDQRPSEHPPVVSPSGSDVTPRLEAPTIVATQPTPQQTEPHHHPDGFFDQRPVQIPPTNPAQHEGPSRESPTPSIISSASSSRLRDAVLDVTRRMSSQIDLGLSGRPTVQRDLSNASASSAESADSFATVVPDGPRQGEKASGSYAAAPFPNQAFSALHHQQYPRPYIPPSQRTPPFPPLPFGDRASSNQSPGNHVQDRAAHSNHGLFDPSPIKSHSGTPVSESSYPSPYLHHLHTQVPKETHVADIDVDPISGRKLINDYEIIDELGRGTHGKVKLGRSLTTNNFVAIKIVERFPKKRRLGRLGKAEDKVKMEVAILKKARHPHIVALLEVIDDPARRKVYIVLERVDMGEIPWRTPGAKEICIVETRRYERESVGNFHDDMADEEDDAIISLAKARRIKAARSKFRHQRRRNGADNAHWSIELAPDPDEESSEADTISRSSSFPAESSPELDRILSRSTESIPHPEQSDLLATVKPHAPRHDQSDLRADLDALAGTMYGAFEDPASPARETRRDMSGLSEIERVITEEDAEADYQKLTRNLSQNNLAQRADEILSVDLHQDLMYVPSMTLQACRESFRDTLLGLQYLHYQGIIHRDIKPPNLLQTRDHRTKISDFGVSYLGRPIADDNPDADSETDHDFDEAKELAKNVGTAAFYAPELCIQDSDIDHPPIGKPIDVWALGITLFCMIFARVPFVENEWVVMRRIAEDPIYIPSKRLRPVRSRPRSRSPPRDRQWGKYSSFRSPHSLEYEDVPDELIDLLQRLLTKDVKQRATLDEIRFHPWVTADLPDREGWLETSTPARQAEGKKIEVSKEDVEKSVVPITIMDKIRSGLMKAVGSVGLGRTASTRRRNASQEGSATSASSSNTNMQADLHPTRQSVRSEEPVVQALKSSREHDHPLAKSLTVSPVHSPQQQRSSSHTTSLVTPRSDVDALTPTQVRQPRKDDDRVDNNISMLSTTASVRTVLPVESQKEGYFDGSAPTSPTLTGHAEITGSSDRFSNLLGSATRLLKSVRDRSTTGRSEDRASVVSTRSSDAGTESIHGDPSVAVSNAYASGQLNLPNVLRDLTPASSKSVSPNASRQSSIVTTPDLSVRHGGFEDFALPKSAPAHKYYSGIPPATSEHKPPTPQTRPGSRLHARSKDEDFERAEHDLIRRQVAEDLGKQQQSSPVASNFGETDACTPSPDDQLFSRGTSSKHTAASSGSFPPPSVVPSLDNGPPSPGSSVTPSITPVTSEDRIKMMPTPASSTPSIPSASSEQNDSKQETPVTAHKISPSDLDPETDPPSSRFDAKHHLGRVPILKSQHVDDDDDEYHADAAVETDGSDYDDSSDDGGGLQMTRRKHVVSPAYRSTSINVGNLARIRERRETGSSTLSKKSDRSASSGPTKRDRPTNSSSMAATSEEQ